MCATRAVLVLLFAVIACAVAIPAALPQPDSPAVAPGAPIVAIEEAQRSALEKRQIGSLENGPEAADDLKASSTYGYGYYHHYYPYRPYYGYYGYPYGYGGYYGYPYHRPYYYPYYYY